MDMTHRQYRQRWQTTSDSAEHIADFTGLGKEGNAPVVMVVEDDITSMILAVEALESAGVTVLQAEDGQEAYELCELHCPDIIIMDVMMPRMNGYDACRAIRESEAGEHIPILMVTGLDDIASINQAYEVGATDFLPKPINYYLLPHRVRYMLRGKKTADALRASQVQLDHAQRIARLGHWEWLIERQELRWSKACHHLLPVGGNCDISQLKLLLQMVHVEDRTTLEESFLHAERNGIEFTLEFRVCVEGERTRILRMQAEPLSDENGVRVSLLGTIQDVTERHETQQQIHELAYYDHVTGLPNRALLYERMNLAISRARRRDEMFALLFLDLDRFKLVNDTLGHDAGDDLLTQVSKRLDDVIRKADLILKLDDRSDPEEHTIARLGGDEFVVLLSEINKVEDAARVARRISKLIAESYDIEGSRVNISTTIGISVYPHDGCDAETLIKNADIAMYHAKKRGRNGYQFFSEDIQVQALERFALEQELRKAIDLAQFRLVYQPKVFVGDGKVIGVEALIRWDHPERGPIPPLDFITLAEETELIIPLGAWIIEAACEQTRRWHEMGFGDLQIAVNCSSIQLMRANMPELLMAVLERTGLHPSFLEIELTESLLLDDAERGIKILEKLQETGIMTSIDDFGTGFSSMSYLRRLPVDKLKIDQSFVREINNSDSDEAIISAILTLSKNLGLSVVAEGVESQDQLDFLLNRGCDEIQGYLISPPLTPDEFTVWMQARDGQYLKKTG